MLITFKNEFFLTKDALVCCHRLQADVSQEVLPEGDGVWQVQSEDEQSVAAPGVRRAAAPAGDGRRQGATRSGQAHHDYRDVRHVHGRHLPQVWGKCSATVESIKSINMVC